MTVSKSFNNYLFILVFIAFLYALSPLHTVNLSILIQYTVTKIFFSACAMCTSVTQVI